VLLIALGVTLSSDRTKTVTKVISSEATPSPSISLMPSFSQVPSVAPTGCSFMVSANMQQLEFMHPESFDPKVAIDGGNLVVVSRDITGATLSGNTIGSLYVVFHSLSEDGVWERVASFIEGGLVWDYFPDGLAHYSVSLSKGTAVVGLPPNGAVNAYEQNRFNLWAKVASPFEPTKLMGCGGLGQTVSIDDDLMTVSDTTTCQWEQGISVSPNAAYVFRRVGGIWEQIHTIDYDGRDKIVEFIVKGSTILVVNDNGGFDMINLYQLEKDKENGILQYLQEPFASKGSIRAMRLGNSQLVYSTEDGFYVYQRQAAHQEFALLQYINSSSYDDEAFGSSLALDNDVLIAGGSNQTYVFTRQSDGLWEEMLALDEGYSNYQISGRMLIATREREVHSMNIIECIQPVPTQVPSISVPPTACHWINFSAGEYCCPWEATIKKIDGSEAEIVMTWEKPREAPPVNDTLCLQPGRYQFTFEAA